MKISNHEISSHSVTRICMFVCFFLYMLANYLFFSRPLNVITSVPIYMNGLTSFSVIDNKARLLWRFITYSFICSTKEQ